MATKDPVQHILARIAGLPEMAQEEVLHALLDAHAEQLGIYALDPDERAALAKSGEDMRLGRFAADDDIDQGFNRYAA